MRHIKKTILAVGVIAVAITLPAVAIDISGAGATFPYPIYAKWADAYKKETGNGLNYQSIGSGGGIKQISAKTVTFGASDMPLKAEQLEKDGLVQFPTVLGGVVPVINVEGIKPGDIVLDGAIIGDIFLGKIKSWDDAAIKKLNASAKLPAQPIVVVHRSDASGTTEVFTDFLSKRSPVWVAALGAGRSVGKQIVWPVGLAGKGNDGVAGMLDQVDGAIGYLELSYVLSQGVPYGQVQNRAGAFVQPCPATVRRASDGVTYPADLCVSLTDGRDPQAYPITGTTYVLVDADQPDRPTAAALVGFLSWVLTTGQDLSAPLGYAPLGERLQGLAAARLHAITVEGTALVAAPSASPSRGG